jgi:hypothetical protein
VNEGCLSSFDKLFFLFSPYFIFKKNAAVMRKYFMQIRQVENDEQFVKISIDDYKGNNSFVLEMMQYLEANLKMDLAGAYVHGSLATNDQINYSDFDALVILKDEVFTDKSRLSRVAYSLCESRKHMLRMDPLQHHGWFVLTESDLHQYPLTYFPLELFSYSKSIFSFAGTHIKVNVNRSEDDFTEPFISLCSAIERRIASHLRPKNLYELKNLLSEFMLLPALYLQARDRKGIYKRFSFEQARNDFSEEEWNIMDSVSMLRSQWKINYPGWKVKLISSTRFLSLHISKILSPSIPEKLQLKLDEKFYGSLLNFTKAIRNKIQ